MKSIIEQICRVVVSEKLDRLGFRAKGTYFTMPVDKTLNIIKTIFEINEHTRRTLSNRMGKLSSVRCGKAA